ncbi:MAG TPA: hypothetical protein VMR21_03760 [Vicinamibacteria bacterium]|nr:hypothetical protein [Vicinamibacteria bacterium]
MRITGPVAALLLTTAASVWAGEGEAAKPPRAEAEVLDLLSAVAPLVEALSGSTAGADEAPRLLAEALRTGTIDGAAWGRVVRWVLNEKEETVARGLADVLRSVPAARGRDAARWDATTTAVLGAFEQVLRDAQLQRRPDSDAVLRSVASAAAPAVIAALREAMEEGLHPAASPTAPPSPPPAPAPQDGSSTRPD